MAATTNTSTMMGNWIQTGGQDQLMEVDYYSPAWYWEQRDKRTDSFPMLNMHPMAILGISLIYVLLVTWLGPMFMRNRKPYSLTTTLLVYNFIQVVISVYIVVEGLDAGWARHYSWLCQNVEAGNDKNSTAMRMINITYIYFINKYLEFLDTFFFVARKKDNQVTFLHVYHHAIMPVFAWVQIRWLPGGQEILIGIINCFVHVVMYSYYLLSALGPKVQPYLWWKKYITLLQLAQFTFGIVHSLPLATGVVQCGYPWQNSLAAFILLEAPFFYLFFAFYKKSYSRKSASKSIKKTE